MSNRNRRGEVSTGKQSMSRLSRIAVPLRRPSSMRERSLERASSLERISGVPYQPASAMKRNRSSSATPLRTPCRPVPYPGASITMTTEKQRQPIDDKKLIQQQTARITEYLQKNETVVGKDFNFKSMSTKQFIDIFSHLLKFVVGNKLKIEKEKNYVEDIVSLLSQIEYPFTVNKSWLKTPAAPHALTHIIILFAWLLDFAPTPDSVLMFEDEYALIPTDFPDKEFALMLNNWAKTGFSLWNKSEDEELKLEIQNVFLRKTTNLESLAELEANLQQLSLEVKVRNPRKYKKDFHKKMSTLEEEKKQLESKVRNTEITAKKTGKNCEENLKAIVQLEHLCERNQEQINEAQRRIESIEAAIKTQKMSKNERADLISNVQYLKQVLEAKKKTIFQLQDTDASHQVLYTRLIKKKIDAVANFNSYLQQFFAEQNSMVDVNVEDMYIDQNPEVSIDEQILRIEPVLEKIMQATYEKIKFHANEIAELEQKLKKVVYEHDTVLDDQLRNSQQKCEEYSTVIEGLDMEVVNAKKHQAEKMVEMRRIESDIIARITDLEKDIAMRKDEINKWEGENREIFQYADNKLAEYNENVGQNVERLEGYVERFHTKVEEVKRSLKDVGYELAL